MEYLDKIYFFNGSFLKVYDYDNANIYFNHLNSYSTQYFLFHQSSGNELNFCISNKIGNNFKHLIDIPDDKINQFYDISSTGKFMKVKIKDIDNFIEIDDLHNTFLRNDVELIIYKRNKNNCESPIIQFKMEYFIKAHMTYFKHRFINSIDETTRDIILNNFMETINKEDMKPIYLNIIKKLGHSKLFKDIQEEAITNKNINI